MQRLLIILGLVIIPFYEIFLKVLPFVKSIAPDSRCTKEAIALVFALSIGLLAVFQGTLKPFKNKYFLIIPVFLLFNIIMAPHIDMFINNIESGDFYFWKPFAEVLCFSLMIIAISSIEINFDEILKIMVICGTVMASYMILQSLGFDQFWNVKPESVLAKVRNCAVGGNLGQYTIVASFIVMMVPLAMYLKKYWCALIITTATIITTSAMAILSIFLVWIISIFYLYKELRRPMIILCIIMAIVFPFLLFKNESLRDKIILRMDGRYEVWKQTLHDIKYGQIPSIKERFPYTGIGLGRFGYLFQQVHNVWFQQAHNDILEFIYDCGFIGGFLLLGGIVYMLLMTMTNLSPICFSIILSFITVFFCSLGSFPFQLGAHQFYSAVLVGLLHNEKIIRRVK